MQHLSITTDLGVNTSSPCNGHMSPKNERLACNKILTPDQTDQIRVLHPIDRYGKACVARARQTRWKERMIAIPDLPDYTRFMAGQTDVYLSQQSFYGRRTISQLAQIGSCYVDLDYYKIRKFEQCPPEYVAALVLMVLEDQNLPPPSVIYSTGRGLLAVWLHDLVPRQVLPRWKAMQAVLSQALKPFGADRLALDAARVFRLTGTLNSSAGKPVRECVVTSYERWDFEDLAREVLPLGRAELHALGVERAKRKADKILQPGKKILTAASYWETVLADLQKLRKLRWFGDLPEGQRDAWLFLAINGMSWLCPPMVLVREAYALASECGGWSEAETKSRMSAILNRARAASAGHMITYRGKQVDARYRFKAATMTDWLEITNQEMHEADLTILVDEQRRQYRDKLRKRQDRLADGARSHEQLVRERLELGREALHLQQLEGLTRDQIAQRLGVSLGRISKAMREAKKNG